MTPKVDGGVHVSRELGELKAAIERLTKSRPKDAWDKAEVVGGLASGLMIPVVIALSTLYATNALEVSDRQAAWDRQEASQDFQNALAEQSRRISEGSLCESLMDDLRLKESRRAAARTLELVAPAFAATILAELESSRAVEPSRERVQQHLDAFGGWPLRNGDPDMDTDRGDIVNVTCETELVHEGSSVYLSSKFSAAEYRGDRTAYSGERRIPVWTDPKGRTIERIEASGGTRAVFRAKPVGENHGLLSFPAGGTFWSQLQYRVDKRGPDNAAVGFGGELEFFVVLKEPGD